MSALRGLLRRLQSSQYQCENYHVAAVQMFLLWNFDNHVPFSDDLPVNLNHIEVCCFTSKSSKKYLQRRRRSWKWNFESHESVKYHEEAVSAQNYGPIFLACTPECS